MSFRGLKHIVNGSYGNIDAIKRGTLSTLPPFKSCVAFADAEVSVFPYEPSTVFFRVLTTTTTGQTSSITKEPTMGFMDEVSKYHTQTNMCKVNIFLEHQDKAELKAAGFSTVVTDKDIRDAHARHTLKAVTRALKDRGFTGSDESLAKHIKNQCTCVKAKVEVHA